MNLTIIIPLIFQLSLMVQETSLCIVQLDNGTLAPKTNTTLTGKAPTIYTFEVSEKRILVHTQVNVTCVVSGIPSDSPVLFTKLGETKDFDLHISNGGTKYILFNKTVTQDGNISRTFTILDYSFNDDGIYTCYLNVTGCKIVKQLKITGYRGPVITSFTKTSSQNTYIGDDVNLTCFYYSTIPYSDEPLIHFFKRNVSNGNRVESVYEIKRKYTYQQPTYENGRYSRTLSIYNVQSSEATEYTCSAEFERVIDNATYTLSTVVATIYTFEVSEKRILVHTQVNVTCVVSGIPSDSPVLFTKLGETKDFDLHISNGGTKYILFNKTVTQDGNISRTFTILDYSFNDDGIYTCYLNVTGCKIVKQLKITGYRGPVITSFTKTSSQNTYIGDDVNLTCFYYSTIPYSDEPLIHFFKRNVSNGNRVESVYEIKRKYTYQQPTYENGRYSRTLSIYNVQSSEATEYTCSAEFERVIDNATYTLSTVEVRANAEFDDDGVDIKILFYCIGTAVAISVVFCLFFLHRKMKRPLKKKNLDFSKKLETETDMIISSGIVKVMEAKNYFYSGKQVQEYHLSNAINGPSSHQYDVFICYSSLDRDWVKNTLLKELESRGIKACIDYRDFLVGAYIVKNIIDAIYGSRKTIAILSPDFMKSVYCKHELKTALSSMAHHQVIPLLYKTCEVPDFLTDKTYLDWCHTDVQPYFWDLLVKAIMSDV